MSRRDERSDKKSRNRCCGQKEEIGDFPSIDPYEMAVMLGEGGCRTCIRNCTFVFHAVVSCYRELMASGGMRHRRGHFHLCHSH
jgi:hypothetical protein